MWARQKCYFNVRPDYFTYPQNTLKIVKILSWCHKAKTVLYSVIPTIESTLLFVVELLIKIFEYVMIKENERDYTKTSEIWYSAQALNQSVYFERKYSRIKYWKKYHLHS